MKIGDMINSQKKKKKFYWCDNKLIFYFSCLQINNFLLKDNDID